MRSPTIRFFLRRLNYDYATNPTLQHRPKEAISLDLLSLTAMKLVGVLGRLLQRPRGPAIDDE